MAISNSTDQSIEPRVSKLHQALSYSRQRSEDFINARFAEDKKKIQDGTHRFEIHPGQAIFLRPRGFLIDREEDRLKRLARNAAAIKLWDNRYVEVRDDGFVIRERETPKPKKKLRLVRSDGH